MTILLWPGKWKSIFTAHVELLSAKHEIETIVKHQMKQKKKNEMQMNLDKYCVIVLFLALWFAYNSEKNAIFFTMISTQTVS